MFFSSLLLAFLVALLLTAIFSAGFGYRGPWDSLWAFFLVVFFFAWIAGLWLTPVGWPLFGIYWMPALFFGFVIALLLAAATPDRPPRSRVEAAQQVEAERVALGSVGAIFWILIAVLVVAVVVSYLV